MRADIHNGAYTKITGDFGHSVSSGDLVGVDPVYKFGHNDSVTTSSITLWGEGGIYVTPTTASIMKVSSSSTDDVKTSGTGAWTVQVYGLDANYVEQNEIVDLTGQTEANTTLSYLRVFRMIVRTGGTGGENAGILYVGTGTVTTGKPAVVYSLVEAGFNQSLQAFWTVPLGKTFFLTHIFGSIGKGKDVEFSLCVRPENEVYQVKDKSHFYQNNGGKQLSPPLKYTEKTDIEIRAISDAASTAASGSFNGYTTTTNNRI